MAVPFAIANAGFIGGIVICMVITGASIAGSNMLLQIKLRYPDCETFGDLGFKVYGRPGEVFGNLTLGHDIWYVLMSNRKFSITYKASRAKDSAGQLLFVHALRLALLW